MVLVRYSRWIWPVSEELMMSQRTYVATSVFAP